MHLPAHPLWFWLIAISPLILWLGLWIAAERFHLSLKPLSTWLWVGYFAFGVPYFLIDPFVEPGRHRTLRLVLGTAMWTCFTGAAWIKRRSIFDTLRPSGARWYFPWKAAEFSVPLDTRILVKDVDAVGSWYAEKLGLRKLAPTSWAEPGTATYKFKADGLSVVLTTRRDFRTEKTPIFFTKKISKMRDIMFERGIPVGAIERDRQGTRFFQIHDPEGNELEVVEEQ